MRFGLSTDLGGWWVHPQIQAAVRAAGDALADAGAVVDEVDPKIGADDEWTWIQLWGVFMSGYFGHLVDEWADRMDPDVLALIELGNRMSATEYKRLELARTDLWRRVSGVLAGGVMRCCAPPWPHRRSLPPRPNATCQARPAGRRQVPQ